MPQKLWPHPLLQLPNVCRSFTLLPSVLWTLLTYWPTGPITTVCEAIINSKYSGSNNNQSFPPNTQLHYWWVRNLETSQQRPLLTLHVQFISRSYLSYLLLLLKPLYLFPSLAPGTEPCIWNSINTWCMNEWISISGLWQNSFLRTASLDMGCANLCSLHLNSSPYYNTKDLSKTANLITSFSFSQLKALQWFLITRRRIKICNMSPKGLCRFLPPSPRLPVPPASSHTTFPLLFLLQAHPPHHSSLPLTHATLLPVSKLLPDPLPQ